MILLFGSLPPCPPVYRGIHNTYNVSYILYIYIYIVPGRPGSLARSMGIGYYELLQIIIPVYVYMRGIYYILRTVLYVQYL